MDKTSVFTPTTSYMGDYKVRYIKQLYKGQVIAGSSNEIIAEFKYLQEDNSLEINSILAQDFSLITFIQNLIIKAHENQRD